MLRSEKKLVNNDSMLYVQTACTIALLKVETISDCREKKLCQKSTSSLSNIISSFINCIPLVRTTALSYKKKVFTWNITFVHRKVSKLKEILASMYLGHQRLRPFCLLHDITQNLGVKYIFKDHSHLHTIF